MSKCELVLNASIETSLVFKNGGRSQSSSSLLTMAFSCPRSDCSLKEGGQKCYSYTKSVRLTATGSEFVKNFAARAYDERRRECQRVLDQLPLSPSLR